MPVEIPAKTISPEKQDTPKFDASYKNDSFGSPDAKTEIIVRNLEK